MAKRLFSNRVNQLDTGISLYTAAQIKSIEQSYAKKHEQGTYPLMEKAGSACFDLIHSHWPDARKILVLTGSGNNGGDGFVVARLAAERRYKVSLCHLSPQEKIKGDALKAFRKMPAVGIERLYWNEFDLGKNNLGDFDLVIDAMLGTGIKGQLRSPYDSVIAVLNQSAVPVLSVDIPSGIESDTGCVMSDAVKANVTVTFIGHKRGLYTGESADYRGEVVLRRLDVPDTEFASHEFEVIAEDWRSLKKNLLPRSMVAHKGDFGHSLIIGGSDGMAGAAILASIAAARTGSGRVSAILESNAETLIAHQPEVMARNLKAPDDAMANFLSEMQSIVIGPGLGRGERAEAWMNFIRALGLQDNVSQIWDADALYWLADNPDFSESRILTPHPGEAAKLLGISSSEVNQDRFQSVTEIVRKYGGVCVLKGAGTLVCGNGGVTLVCPVGNPGMASGGMGDVLAGIIGGLTAQKLSPLLAAALGVCVHGEAADLAAGPKQHYRGLLASDLILQLPTLLNPA